MHGATSELLRQRAREALAILAPYEEPLLVAYKGIVDDRPNEDLRCLRYEEFYQQCRVQKCGRLVQVNLAITAFCIDPKGPWNPVLDGWIYSFVRDTLRLMTEHSSIEAARAAVQPSSGLAACAWMASSRARAKKVRARCLASAGHIHMQAIEAAQRAERWAVFDEVIETAGYLIPIEERLWSI